MASADGTGRIRATIVLADAAQVADGRLNMLGGGVRIVPARPQQLGIGLLLDIPWERGDELVDWSCELLDADGVPVIVGDLPVLVQGQFNTARPQGWPEGMSLVVPIAINFTALPLEPLGRYRWRLIVDGETDPEWEVELAVGPAPVEQV